MPRTGTASRATAAQAVGGSRLGRHTVSVLMTILLALLALGLPATYFTVGYAALSSTVQTKAEIKAEVVTQAISRSPDLWRYEDLRLRELLVRLPVELNDEHAAILDDKGDVIAASSHVVSRPLVEHRVTLYDSGTPVGQVLVQHSLRRLLLETALAGLLGLAVAGGVFAVLRQLIARNRRFAAQMFDEQERARVTLHSIGDAVITTDAEERVEYLNPVAERLTQWTLAEARGRPIAEVCPLIDETTMKNVAMPVARAMRDGQLCHFDGKELALVRRDGTTLAIEDSAAPIRNKHTAVIGGAMVFRDVSATRRLAQRISWAATHDALTGLVNRREFETRVEAALLSAQNSARPHVLCYLDLDQFKIVNDTCGHAAGDLLLRQISAVLQDGLRESDTLARLGGDEFGVLLEGCTLEHAERIAADLLTAVRNHRFQSEGRAFAVGVSIGMVAIGPQTPSRADIFAAADTACYSAKEQGRNRVCVYRSTDVDMAKHRTEMRWVSRLTSALEEGRFELHYQPYMALGGNSARGQHIEVLLRLIDEDGSLVAPGSFMPAAERFNFVPAIDRWVIHEVFSRHAELTGLMGGPLMCAINLSGATLNAEGILDYIREQAARYRLPPGSVCFEVTETAAINNMRHATQFMRAVKSLGFCFALDDFGIGTSSLAYLKTLPVDYLKIDGSFIRNIATDPIDRAMADTINRVGHIMGLQTVGEYAESDAVIDELRALGVDFAQGYGVQRPRALPRAPAGSAVGTAATATASATASTRQEVGTAASTKAAAIDVSTHQPG
jgi:diguanylate cyclase (GGDEF)-like protein/PAS domain S-box-containing protein